MQGLRLLFLFLRAFQLAAILGAELVRTVGAAQGFIGMLPEALGMENNAEFPYYEHNERQSEQAPCVKAADEDHW